MKREQPIVDAELEKLQRETFDYFLHETNPANGLVIDKTVRIGPPVSRPLVLRSRLTRWASSGDSSSVPPP